MTGRVSCQRKLGFINIRPPPYSINSSPTSNNVNNFNNSNKSTHRRTLLHTTVTMKSIVFSIAVAGLVAAQDLSDVPACAVRPPIFVSHLLPFDANQRSLTADMHLSNPP